MGPEEVELAAGGPAGGGALGVVGIGLGGLVAPTGGRVLIDFDLRALRIDWAGRYRFPSAEPDPVVATAAHDDTEDLTVRLGLRRRIPVAGAVWAQAGVAAERGGSGLVLWSDSRPVWTPVPLVAGRAMAGLLVDTSRLFIDLQISESLAPVPIRTAIDASVARPLTPRLSARLGYSQQWRRGVFDAGEAIDTHSSAGLAELGVVVGL